MSQIKSGKIVTLGGEDQSGSLELGTDTLVGIYIPSAIEATHVGIQSSEDNLEFSDLLENGAPLTLPIGGGSYVALDPVKMLGARFIKLLHFDGSGAPVTESANRSFTIMFRSFE